MWKYKFEREGPAKGSRDSRDDRWEIKTDRTNLCDLSEFVE